MACCTYGNTGKPICKCRNDVSIVDLEILKHNVKEDKIKKFDLTKPFYYCDRKFCSIVCFSEVRKYIKKGLEKIGVIIMSKTWYPVIDYSTCLECGTCVLKCTHGVYEKGTNIPKVIYPEGCIEGCTGCQKLCPSDSIQYVGQGVKKSNCGCNCNC